MGRSKNTKQLFLTHCSLIVNMENIRIILKNPTSDTFINQMVSNNFNEFRQKTNLSKNWSKMTKNYWNFRIQTKQNHVLHDVPMCWTWDCLKCNGEYL